MVIVMCIVSLRCEMRWSKEDLRSCVMEVLTLFLCFWTRLLLWNFTGHPLNKELGSRANQFMDSAPLSNGSPLYNIRPLVKKYTL
jgi:hypothetical protein